MTLIKVCGLRSTEDITLINEAGPDMAGMIMVPGFRRTVSRADAKTMVRALSPSIRSVGVFMDQDPDEVVKTTEYVGFDIVQLHGGEDDGYIERIRDSLHVPVIKTFGIGREQLEALEDSPADFILVDPGHGSGIGFDLTILKDIDRDIIVAGGLTPDNVGAAIRQISPYGVDTSSGIETDGAKDRDKINRFISAVRAEDDQKEEKK